jgi:mannose-1-phosphate guanylyltransferase
MEHYYAMILAGGGGTRLWPLSRKDMPKQMLPIIEDKTMFRVSVERLAPLFPPENIYVVTGRNYMEAMRADVPEIPVENFILEPYGRDNAAAAGLGLSVIHKRDPLATVAILTADHYIAKQETFRHVLEMACQVAQEDYIVTLGISPSFPSTGFGYIKQGEALRKFNGFTCYHSLGFTEKPDILKATAFLASGMYSWNSGMFIWKTETALNEFRRQQPELYRLLQELAPCIDTQQFENRLEELWGQMPKISIDFAIMEGAEKMAVIPVDIGWSDVCSWASLFEVMELDNDGNGFKGNAPHRITIDTQNTLVLSNRLIVTIGLEDLIIIDTDDVLMVCHKDRSQDVREVVNQLRAANHDIYL